MCGRNVEYPPSQKNGYLSIRTTEVGNTTLYETQSKTKVTQAQTTRTLVTTESKTMCSVRDMISLSLSSYNKICHDGPGMRPCAFSKKKQQQKHVSIKFTLNKTKIWV